MMHVHTTYDVDSLIESISRIPELVTLHVNGEPLTGFAAIAYLVSLPRFVRRVSPDCPSPTCTGSCPGHQVQ